MSKESPVVGDMFRVADGDLYVVVKDSNDVLRLMWLSWEAASFKLFQEIQYSGSNEYICNLYDIFKEIKAELNEQHT